jgi:hypothetical protein
VLSVVQHYVILYVLSVVQQCFDKELTHCTRYASIIAGTRWDGPMECVILQNTPIILSESISRIKMSNFISFGRVLWV